jgi:hypothetical protein
MKWLDFVEYSMKPLAASTKVKAALITTLKLDLNKCD